MAERIRNLQPGEASYSNSLKRPTSPWSALQSQAPFSRHLERDSHETNRRLFRSILSFRSARDLERSDRRTCRGTVPRAWLLAGLLLALESMQNRGGVNF